MVLNHLTLLEQMQLTCRPDRISQIKKAITNVATLDGNAAKKLHNMKIQCFQAKNYYFWAPLLRGERQQWAKAS